MDPVENQLVCSVRLRSEGDLGSVHEQLASTDGPLHNGNRVSQVMLSQGPTTSQWTIRAEPSHYFHSLPHRLWSQTKDGAVVKEHIDRRLHSMGKGMLIGQFHAQDGTGEIELIARQRFVFSAGALLNQCVQHGKAQMPRQGSRPSDCENCPSLFQEAA